MDLIYQQLLERNERETKPFVSIYDSYTSLLSLTDTLQAKCAAAEIEVENLRRQIQDGKGGSSSSTLNTSAMKSAMKNETRLRDKLEQLQEEFNAMVKKERETASSLQEAQILNSKNEKTIKTLIDELEDEKSKTSRLEQQLMETGSSSKLAEEQNDKLKEAIRSLQGENDELKKENLIFEGRLLAEKGKAVDEMNELTDMVERLKAEVDMLRSLSKVEKNIQESNKEAAKSSWFGKGTKSTKPLEDSEDSVETRKFGTLDEVIVPSQIKQTITAHMMDGTCVRYDHTGPNLIATASSDSTVKVWDTVSGKLRGTFRGSPGHPIICCDIASPLVVGGGSDKTCRVWNLTNERMIHQLVGHENKITCVRLFGGVEKPMVITGSADRSLKVWDISRKTYRQGVTLRHSSTSTCVDVASDSQNVVSGHMDGGIRFWDLRSGERIADASGLHDGGISSVQFNPVNNAQVLTSSLDATLKIVDVRHGGTTPVQTLRLPPSEGTTAPHWSRATFSPDGRYVAAGASPGTIYVWNAADGTVRAKWTEGHTTAGIMGVDWCRGGSGGQQVASFDRKGLLVLWA